MAAEGPDSLFADLALARRLESLCATELRRFADTARALDPGSGASWTEIAGGSAAFAGAGLPVNRALGLGLRGPVTADDIAALERFHLDRGTQPSIGVSSLAHATLLEALAVRGWVADGFENVLVRSIVAGETLAPPAPCIDIREVISEEDRGLWGLVAATGFSHPLPPLSAQMELARIVVRRPGTRLFLAYVDGKVAGTGEALIEDGVVWLSADATLPQFRGRGVQSSLQRHRLALGVKTGCVLAATESEPGSASQRNQERAGFRIAYTRLDLTLP